MQADTVRLSLCMIVRDERACLQACLRSVRGLVDQTIVVDTGSVDGTQDLARECGAEVVQAAWRQDFSLARNEGLMRARGSWILVLDADEELLPGANAAIDALLRRRWIPGQPPRVAFNLLQKSSSDGGRTGMLVPIVRLFPNHPQVRYEWPVHEQVAASLGRLGMAIEETDIEILHHGYADPSRNRDKQRRNIRLLQRQIADGEGVTALTWFLLGGAHLDLGDAEQALAAYRESLRLSAGAPPLAGGAWVRVATCLVRLARFREALAWIDAGDPGAAGGHAEVDLLRGECERSLGNAAAARVAYERVLSFPARPLVPPCNLEHLKTAAAMAVAGIIRDAGDPARAVALLRALKECRTAGRPITQALLQNP